MAKKRNTERDKKFCSLLEQGYTLQDIGNMYNLTRERVRQIIKVHMGVSVKEFREITGIERKTVVETREKNMSLKALAEKYPILQRFIDLHKRMSKSKRNLSQNYLCYKKFHKKVKEQDNNTIRSLKEENKKLEKKLARLQKKLRK